MRRIAALLVVLSVTVCCANLPKPAPVARTPNDQWNAGVQVVVRCPDGDRFGGTGVVVSNNRVITALHVATCGDDHLPAVELTVNGGTNQLDEVSADVEITAPTDDLARLLVDPGALRAWYTPLSIGAPPPLGARVCWMAIEPRPTYRCGTSQGLRSDGRLYFDGFIEFGNSGSPLYNDAGQVVGILLATRECQGGYTCNGQAVPMQGREWLLP